MWKWLKKWVFPPQGYGNRQCAHSFTENTGVVVCARNDICKTYACRTCTNCGRVEIWHGAGFWKEADTQLVLPKEQWLALYDERQKNSWQDKLATPAYRGTSGKYRSI